MTFKQFLKEDMLGTLDKKLKIDPKEFDNQTIVINPPRKLISSNGSVDDISIPTRFKILNRGKNFMTIRNVSDGKSPYEEKSPYFNRVYTIKGNEIDSFMSPPAGEAGSGGGIGGIGGMSGGGIGGTPSIGGSSPPIGGMGGELGK